MIRELFVSPKCQGTLFLNGDYHEIKKCCDFHWIKMSRLSFHVQGKTNSYKISKIVKELCVQVREKVRESQGTFFHRYLV